MSRHLGLLLLMVFGASGIARPCSCGPAKPACAYWAADAIFLGRVSFTNDDGSGKFTQATLVRFEVVERFKGIAQEVREIWVDPGSFTSCYENYRLGDRYLIFAARKGQLPADTASMTVMPGGSGRAKPLPPGFNSKQPPPIYYAPECSGSRPTNGYPNIDRELASLRAYRSGARIPRVLGNVHLYPFQGWPLLAGPALDGAWITLLNSAVTLKTTTNATGAFSLQTAPAGVYGAWARMPPFRMTQPFILDVPEVGCGYVDIELQTTSTLQGHVLDHRGRPAPKIPVLVQLKNEKLDALVGLYALGTTTNANGEFIITGLPDNEVYISAGSDFPTTKTPYRRVYYPSVHSAGGRTALHLKPGEHRDPMILWLEPPVARSGVKVQVVGRDGRPFADAYLHAIDDRGVWAEFARSDSRGVAEVPCLIGRQYELEARAAWFVPERESSLKTAKAPFTCREVNAAVKLVLDRSGAD
jgi:hypothetical protein